MCVLVTGVQMCALPISGMVSTTGWRASPECPNRSMVKSSSYCRGRVNSIHLVDNRQATKCVEIWATRFIWGSYSRKGRGGAAFAQPGTAGTLRSEEHTSELQSLMRLSYAVFCLKKKTKKYTYKQPL